MHSPQIEVDYDEAGRAARVRWVEEAKASGNSELDVNADWIDFAAAGVNNGDELTDRAIEVLSFVDMAETVYQLGLQGTVSAEEQPQLAERILEARRVLQDRLMDPAIASLVEPNRYNTNMSVAENLLFGTPKGVSFDVNNLAANPYVRKVLHEENLMADFLDIG
jgi:putative ABC transport system ATP-binding protein